MMIDRDSQTIIAQCTPKGSGAIALIRMCGDTALDIADKISILHNGKRLNEVASHTIHAGWIIDEKKEKVDQVMLIVMHAPKTFTGQHTVEITCHNNPFLIEKIIACAVFYGARLAGPGEFSKRAFLHNKIDLVQAEAINELIHASNQQALRQSLSQLEGSFSHWINTIEKSLIQCLSLSEASFEFIDEEHMEFGDRIKQELQKIITVIELVKKTFNQQQQIRQGIRIALIGSVNAGKSSLFNALLNQKRSIVSNIEGTTRDVIEAGIYGDGYYWTLVDTAGLRSTDDSIEKEGIERSLQEAQKADIILLMLDQSRLLNAEELKVYTELKERFSNKIITIAHKADLPAVNNNLKNQCDSLVSVYKPETIHCLYQLITQKIKSLFVNGESPFLLNQRHCAILLELEKKLHTILVILDESTIAYELLSYHLSDALESVSELTGKGISEKAMDTIFKEFCVGK